MARVGGCQHQGKQGASKWGVRGVSDLLVDVVHGVKGCGGAELVVSVELDGGVEEVTVRRQRRQNRRL